jgi:lysophospholipase L1-like esterase
VRRGGALGLALAFLLLLAPAATAIELRASSPSPGRIALRVTDATPGVALTVRDELTGGTRTLTPSATDSVIRGFAVWSCTSKTRAFSAMQGNETATASLRTPSCAHRLRVAGPRVVKAPLPGALHLFDRWRLGLTARFCVSPPGARERCRSVRVRPGRRETSVRFGARRPGRYLLTASTPQQRLRHTVAASPPSGRLRILATGDSMIQLVDSFIRERAGRASLRSDARVSTGISKPSLLDWRAHAREQVADIRPDVTVMFLGANDGFPMAGADCCGIPWIAEYGRRAREMMRTYARGGRGRVYWLLLPAARGGLFRETFPAVNAALRQAAAGLEDDVRLIELDEVFTPGGRFRRSMKVGGKRVRVRQSDGVHLNVTGARLAAKLIARAIRRDRMLP